MHILIFGELIASNNFFLLWLHTLTLFSHFTGLGVYLQGIPIQNTVDFYWGTNAGIRTLPLLSFLTVLQRVFSSHWSLIFFCISLFLPFAMFLFAYKIIGKITLFPIIAALFYGGNVWIINRLHSGFWQLNIVYAFLPLLITLSLKTITLNKIQIKQLIFYATIYALTASIVLSSQPHFLVITSIFSFCLCSTLFIKRNFSSLNNLLIMYGIAFFLFIGLNTYFIIPSLLFPEQLFTAPNQYFSLASVAFNSQGNFIQNVLRFDPQGFTPTTFTWDWIALLQLVPLVGFLIIFIRCKTRSYLYFSLVFLFFFLAKGFHFPGYTISRWIYEHIFFMHYFRDPARFLSGAALFMSLGIADFSLQKPHSRRFHFSIIVGVIIFFIIINSSSFDKFKNKTLQETNVPSSYIAMQKYINNNLSHDTQHRLLILPNIHGMSGYSWYKNPSPNSSNTLFDDILPLQIPLADSMNYPDTYSNQVSTYLYTKFTQTYDALYLKPLGIKYILVDSSITTPDAEKNIATKAAQILKGRNYQLIHKENNLSLFQRDSPSVLSTSHPIYAIGDLSTIVEPLKNNDIRSVILLNQPLNTEHLDYTILKKQPLLVATANPLLTLISEYLAPKYSINILSAGKNYDQIFGNYEPYKMEYIKSTGELYTSGRAVISSRSITSPMVIPYKTVANKYHVLIKALTTNNISITLSSNTAKKDLLLDTKGKLTWLDEGIIFLNKPAQTITLEKPNLDQVIIDQLVLVPEVIYVRENKRIARLLQSMQKYQPQSSPNQIKENTGMIINDQVSLHQKTNYITYSVSYGKYWESDVPTTIYMSNGYGMTFISKNGEINKLYYLPNFIYSICLFISAISALGMIGYLIYENRKFFNEFKINRNKKRS